ncbi:NAD(P)H-dependent flavin oxidoreductase [Draconibacterium halophilum]|uniref:Nitronate monooxygenase n=1 Tax=Draconibacterium halophilum TaxID=2706887 RepID=A0A6C0RFW2_9BACT|nr:nitronate monooxygenase [Draconibacterium halophilum]QIA07961.1 nitronate monooxygenase [Draconibacterium halophilum]
MNRICNLFHIKYPVVQGGMVWCSGWKLASAVSNSGGLGLLGAGSMHPETLEEHIVKIKAATDKPFGVNVPLMYPETERIMDIIAAHEVPVVFTSAGSPKKWTGWLKDKGITVAHVVSSSFFAGKCETAGVDAIVAEGFEAGGHNGREETTTMALIPSVRKATKLPLLSAGGIGSGEAMLAAMVLGADGVQIGSAFAVSEESSAHPDFKRMVTELGEGGTKLALKKLAPVRLVKNNFFNQVDEAEKSGQSPEAMLELLGRGRAKKGIFEGNLDEGELEIGQVSAQLNTVLPVEEIMENIISAYQASRKEMGQGRFGF